MRRKPAVVVAILLLCAPRAYAQIYSGPPGFREISAEAAAESLKVLRSVEQELKADRNNAALWYRRGMVAWSLAARDNQPPPIRGLDWTLLGHMADTSLRIAAQIAPDRPEYQLAAGRYIASSFGPVNRLVGLQLTGRAVRRARLHGNGSVRASAYLQAARLLWRQFDAREAVTYDREQTPRGLMGRENPLSTAFSATCTRSATGTAVCAGGSGKEDDFDGEYYYLKAEPLFRDAYLADPLAPGALAGLARLYVARSRWGEAASLGSTHIQLNRRDPWGWMLLGLALQQVGDVRMPAILFDSALVRFDSTTRNRLDRIDRILRQGDSARLRTMTPAARRAWERMYWRLSDPIWSVPGNEGRTEFLARIAFAEFRWTMDETGELGADTDRGRTLVRYGIPGRINTSIQLNPALPDLNKITSIWTGRVPVIFSGYERLEFSDPAAGRALFDDRPVLWETVRLRIDSMQTQVARFRGTTDSADVIVAQSVPEPRFGSEPDVKADPFAYLWILSSDATTVRHDSVATVGGALNVFRDRLVRGSYIVRSETSTETSFDAARGTSVLDVPDTSATTFALRGWGMSDVMLATRMEAATDAQRWNDLAFRPLAGALDRFDELSLVWENYDFAADGGLAKYSIRIEIERQRSNPGGIVASVIRGIAGAVGVSRDENTFEISFQRQIPHKPVMLENFAIDVAETPAGTYKLTVTVTDSVSGKSTTRTLPLTISD